MKCTSLVPMVLVVLVILVLLVPGVAFSDSHHFQINPGTLEPIGGSVGLVSNCVTLKPAYVVGEVIAITIQSDGNCQQAELSWGDHLAHIPELTLNLKDKTSATYTHTYATPGVKSVRVIGTVGCVGMAATHVVVVPDTPGPDLSGTPQVSKVHGPGWLSDIVPYEYYLITGSGFGTQLGEVHMYGTFPPGWWQGPQNPYPGPWGPIPGGVLLNTFYWSPRAIAVYVPHMTGVLDQTVQLVVKAPSPNGFTSSAPLSTPFVALRETRQLRPEDVTVVCGPSTEECQHLVGATMSVTKDHPYSGSPVTGTDTLQVQLENSWITKSWGWQSWPYYSATLSSPTGFVPGAANATIKVAYGLPSVACGTKYAEPLCWATKYLLNMVIEGPLGVPHKGPYSATSGTWQLDVSKTLGFSLGSEALDIRKVLADLDARFLALEQREWKACHACAARRHAVQALRARVQGLRARIGATPTDGRIHEALLRHARLLVREADRMEDDYPRTRAGKRP